MLTKSLPGILFANNLRGNIGIINREFLLQGHKSQGMQNIKTEQPINHFYISNSVVEYCRKTAIMEEIDGDWIKLQVEGGYRQWSLDDRFFFIINDEYGITVVYGIETRLNKKKVKVMIFDFDFVGGTLRCFSDSSTRQLVDEGRVIFLQLLSFRQLADVKFHTVPPGGRYATVNKMNELLNEEEYSITVVDINCKL